MRHGTGDGRGRQRRRNSPEAKAWLEIEPKVAGWTEPKARRNRFGIPVLDGEPEPKALLEPGLEQRAEPGLGPKPKKPKKAKRLGAVPPQPPWLDDETWAQLLEMRANL